MSVNIKGMKSEFDSESVYNRDVRGRKLSVPTPRSFSICSQFSFGWACRHFLRTSIKGLCVE